MTSPDGYRSGAADGQRRLIVIIDFVEGHVDRPLAVAEQRVSKDLYAKARRGAGRGCNGRRVPALLRQRGVLPVS